MAKREEIIDLKITNSGGESVKSLREELRAAKEEALQMARAFGDFSPEATAAAAAGKAAYKNAPQSSRDYQQQRG